jgi:hypothetical protein
MKAELTPGWNVFKQIFHDHWDEFKQFNSRYDTAYYDELMDVLPGMNAGVSIFATPSPIEGSRVAEEDIGRLGIEPGAPNAYPSPP